MSKFQRGMPTPILLVERSSNTLGDSILCAESKNNSYNGRRWTGDERPRQEVKTSFGKLRDLYVKVSKRHANPNIVGRKKLKYSGR